MRISARFATAVAAAGAVVLAAAALALSPGCFSPLQPPCAFACAAPPHACPTGYTCGDDGICHSDRVQGECHLTPDAGSADVDGTGNER